MDQQKKQISQTQQPQYQLEQGNLQSQQTMHQAEKFDEIRMRKILDLLQAEYSISTLIKTFHYKQKEIEAAINSLPTCDRKSELEKKFKIEMNKKFATQKNEHKNKKKQLEIKINHL